MVQVLCQTDRGWFPGTLAEEFKRELEEIFQKDIELLSGGAWHRAALVSVYLQAGLSKPDDDTSCVVNIEPCEEQHPKGCGKMFNNWKDFKKALRPHYPKTIYFHPDKERWDQAIDDDPHDWTLRSIYADWLEDLGYDWLAKGQRYQIEHKKTPGPACVLEAAWHEASWFNQHSEGTMWRMLGGNEVIKPEWCLPAGVFKKLKTYLLQRRDGGSHNMHAKSWNSRREAEIYLAKAIS